MDSTTFSIVVVKMFVGKDKLWREGAEFISEEDRAVKTT